MMPNKLLVSAACLSSLFGCASSKKTDAPPPAAKSKFAKLQIGMSRTAAEKLIGVPDDSDTHITGRSFTPFYFGGDTQRYEAFYKNEGQLTYSNDSRFSAPDTLIIISVDRKATGVKR